MPLTTPPPRDGDPTIGRTGGDGHPSKPAAGPTTHCLDAAHAANMSRPRTIRALLLPADAARACRILTVPLSAVGISDAIGGGLLDDTACPPDGPGAHTVYLDADRDAKALPFNHRAWELAARLNWPHLTERTTLRGDALITGLDRHGQDTHVPGLVLAAAVRCCR